MLKHLLAALLLLAPALPAAADIVHLRNGGKIEGRVTVHEDKIVVDIGKGTVSVPKDEILKIEKKPWNPSGAPPPPLKTPAKLDSSYAHPFHAFKIGLPTGWSREQEHARATLSFYGPKETFYQPRMDLFIENDDKDLATYVARYKTAFRKNYTAISFPHEEITTLAGKTAYVIHISFSNGDPPILYRSMWTFIDDAERKFVLSFTCTAMWFDRYHAGIDASMRSIRIHPAPKATTEQKKKFLEVYRKATTVYDEGSFKEALGLFEEASRIVPGFADLHATVGTVRMKLKDLSGAETAYRKAAGIDPADPDHPYNLGVCLLMQSKHDDAIAALKKAVELNPSLEPALTNLGAAYLAKDLVEPARKTLEKAVLENPESAAAHYNLGTAYERLKHPRDAEREYREALKLDPRHERAKAALERLDG